MKKRSKASAKEQEERTAKKISTKGKTVERKK